MSAPAGTIASTVVTGRRSASASTASAWAAERVARTPRAARCDREPGGGAMAAEALEVGRRTPRGRRGGRSRESSGQTPSSRRRSSAISTTGRLEPLDEPRGDDPDHALVPLLAPEDVAAPARCLRRPGTRRARPPRGGSAPRRACRSRFRSSSCGRAARGRDAVVGQEELERDVRPSEPAGRVDPRREPEADGGRVDRRRIDAAPPASAPAARAARACERAQPGRGERAVLVDERDDVRDRREGDEIEDARERGMVVAEQRPGERVRRRRCRRGRGTDSRTGASRRSGSPAAPRRAGGDR